jgi:protein N-lysine methyltransferase METTL21D
MFFYISFLRTPPHSSLQSSPILFTPQVSNDLRTEPFPASVDLFYWWISNTPQNLVRLSEPAKLTTWRQENAYKPLQIQPPPKKNFIAVDGVDCCLILSPSSTITSSVIDLRDPKIGKMPLPVRSLPMRIIPPRKSGSGGVPIKSTTPTTKQEAITRTFRLFGDDGGAATSSTPLMEIKETISFDLDKVTGSTGHRVLGAFVFSLSKGLMRHSTTEIVGQRNRSECMACSSFGHDRPCCCYGICIRIRIRIAAC